MTAAANIRIPDIGWRLVVSDLDGTLLDENGRISPDNRAAIAELAVHGVGFTIATGRLDVMTRAFISQLDVQLPIIACNGAIIRNCRTREILYRHILQTSDAQALVEWLMITGLDYLCYTADQVYYPAGSRRIANFHRYNQIAAETGTIPVPLNLLTGGSDQLSRLDLIKVLAVLPDPDAHRIMNDYLAEHPALSGILSWSDAMDITAVGTNKGNGLIRLSKILGIGVTEIAAFGDNDNDVPLLSTAGLGIAMQNASTAALAVSSLVTTSNGKSGVAAGIRKFILPGIFPVPIIQAD